VNSGLTTTPVITELCAVLHIADEQGEWPEEKPIAELASSYVEAIGRELQSEFDLYQLKQHALNEQLDVLIGKLDALKSQVADMEPLTAEVIDPGAPELKLDTFTPDQHRDLLDRCLQNIQKLS